MQSNISVGTPGRVTFILEEDKAKLELSVSEESITSENDRAIDAILSILTSFENGETNLIGLESDLEDLRYVEDLVITMTRDDVVHTIRTLFGEYFGIKG